MKDREPDSGSVRGLWVDCIRAVLIVPGPGGSPKQPSTPK